MRLGKGSAIALAIFLSSTVVNKPISAQQAPAKLACGGGGNIECSFILWNGGGSVGFVVHAGVNQPIGTAYAGHHYCMHASAPHAAMPNWPSCYKGGPHGQSDIYNSWGIVENGKLNY
jgi:hypothetical protein